MTTLYEKRGRKYVPVGDRWYAGDQMQVGQFRLTYCYSGGGRRYEYNVTPDTAGFVAAAMIAREAIERAISEAKAAQPNTAGAKPYTKKQREILERFRKEMTEAGGLFPDWWVNTSAWDISEAAIKAVREFKP
jgi:hypothetical protein